MKEQHLANMQKRLQKLEEKRGGKDEPTDEERQLQAKINNMEMHVGLLRMGSVTNPEPLPVFKREGANAEVEEEPMLVGT